MSERNRHPLPEELLRLSIGDCQAEEEVRIQTHLTGCRECLAQVEEFRETGRVFSDSYQSDYARSIPPPPRGWQGFRGALHNQTFGHATLRARWSAYLAGIPRMARFARAVPALCAIALALAAVVRMSQAPVVSAGEILRRAATAERDSFRKVSHAAVYQKMRVRVGRTTLTRVVFRDIERHRQVDRWSTADHATVAAPSTVASDLASEFHAARLDWDDPLSPVAIQTWLADREQRSHEPEAVREDAGVFTLTSRIPTDPVTEARFMVRAADYHPISALYRFQDRAGDVELTELAYEVRRIETLDASVRSELSSPGTLDSALTAGTPTPPAGSISSVNLESLEVDALYALHQHHADLGGETEVTRQGSEVKVAGVVVSGLRKAELQSALAHLPELRVELQTAQEAALRQAQAISSAPETATSPASRTPALNEALAARFPDQASRDAFVLDTLECSHQVLAHGFALQRLATRYQPGNIAPLPREARLELQAMSSDHMRALRKNLDSLIERLAPLAGEVQVSQELAANSGEREPDLAALVSALQRLDRVVASLVSGAEADQGGATTLVREYQQLSGSLKQEVARASTTRAER